jgi:hypothetical protein
MEAQKGGYSSHNHDSSGAGLIICRRLRHYLLGIAQVFEVSRVAAV